MTYRRGSALAMSLFLTRSNFHAAHHMSPTRYISSVWHAEITKNNDKIAFEQLQRTWEIIHFIGLKFWYTGYMAEKLVQWKNREKRVAFDLHFWYFLFNLQKRHFFVSSNEISLVQQISAKDALWWNYHLDQKYFIVFYVVPRCIFHVLFFEQCVLCTNLMICINLQFLRTLKKLSLVAFKSASVAPSLEFFFNVLEIQVTFQLLFLADTFSPSFPPFFA